MFLNCGRNTHRNTDDMQTPHRKALRAEPWGLVPDNHQQLFIYIHKPPHSFDPPGFYVHNGFYLPCLLDSSSFITTCVTASSFLGQSYSMWQFCTVLRHSEKLTWNILLFIQAETNKSLSNHVNAVKSCPFECNHSKGSSLSALCNT